jgi:hypothetical protein
MPSTEGTTIRRETVMNPFGEALSEIMEERGVSVGELAELIREASGAPEVTEGYIVALMTTQDGEEFTRLMNSFVRQSKN